MKSRMPAFLTRVATITVSIWFAVPICRCEAASFECKNARSWAEKTICGNNDLSELDELLAASVETADKTKLVDWNGTNLQMRWLKSVRDKCTTEKCLINAYEDRINELAPPITYAFAKNTKISKPKQIVTGRCHMLSCWWWGIDEVKLVKEAKGEKLYRVRSREARLGVSELHYRNENYPDLPPKDIEWEASDNSYTYVFCSKRLPTVLFQNEDKEWDVNPIFMEEGTAWGATEGAGNLYYHVCNEKPGTVKGPTEGYGDRLKDPLEIFYSGSARYTNSSKASS